MLSFIEYLNEGVYVALGFDLKSGLSIQSFISDNNIKNHVNIEDLHVTLIYSQIDMKPFEAKGLLETPILANIIKFDIYNGALVGVLDCPVLEMRHTDILNRYNGSHSYDTYSPHVTFAYNFKGSLNELSDFNTELYLINEYKSKLRED